MSKTYVIGDIHGCIGTLKRLLYEELNIDGNDKLIFLGDYIDRGDNSLKVVNEVIHLKNRGINVVTLRGNHEQMLINARKFTDNYELWRRNGGGEKTCNSFRIKDLSAMSSFYMDFFNSLEFYYVLDDFICVHGGLNFEIENTYDDTESMIWTRNVEVDKIKTEGRRLIVGHTPTPLEEIKLSLDSDIIKLDGGCAYHNFRRNLGYLVALEIETMTLHYVENIDN